MKGVRITEVIKTNQLSNLMWLYPTLPRDKKEAEYRKRVERRKLLQS